MATPIDRLKLRKVTISGYKSIAPDYPINLEFGDITVLLGANGSGKSNVISFFKMISYMMYGSLQQFVEKAGAGQLFLHYGAQKTRSITGKLRFENTRNFNEYDFNLTPANPDRLIITAENIEYGEIEKGRTPLKYPISSPDFKESGMLSAKGTSKIIRDIISSCKVYQFHDSSDSSPLRQSCHKDFAFYLQSEGSNLATFLYRLKNNYPTNYTKIVSYIKIVMPQFRDFYLKPNDQGYLLLNWQDTSPNDYIMLPHQLSDGSIRFIALATLLLQPPETMPSVIIIDEPELGLHPLAINQLGELIKDAAAHTQIVIATQSPSLIDEFDISDIIVIERDEEHECTVAHKLDGEEFKEWLKTYSNSELWDKNIIGGRP